MRGRARKFRKGPDTASLLFATFRHHVQLGLYFIPCVPRPYVGRLCNCCNCMAAVYIELAKWLSSMAHVQ